MKIILATLLITISLYASNSYGSFKSLIVNNNLDTNIICENGYLVLVATGKIANIDIKRKELYCTDISSWDGDCISKPIPCKLKGNK